MRLIHVCYTLAGNITSSPSAAFHDVQHAGAVPVLDGLQLLRRDAHDLDELDGTERGGDLTQTGVRGQQDVLQTGLAAVQRHVVRHVVTAHQQVTCVQTTLLTNYRGTDSNAHHRLPGQK